MTEKQKIYMWLIIGYALFALSLVLLFCAISYLNRNMNVLYYNQQKMVLVLQKLSDPNDIRIEIPDDWKTVEGDQAQSN